MLGMVKYVTSFKEVGLESCRNSLKGEKKRELKRNEIQFVLKKLDTSPSNLFQEKFYSKF